jgi:hypothetical protein
VSQSYNYPSSSNVTLTGSTNGLPIPTTSIVVGGENSSGNTEPLQLDASGNLKVSLAGDVVIGNVNLTEVGGSAIALGQTTMSASLPVTIASDQSTLAVSAASLPLPTGAATSANQSTEINLLTSRLTGSLVPTAFNEVDLTYIVSGNGAGQIGTAVYKLASSTVKTLTLTYDSSNRLSTVVAS